MDHQHRCIESYVHDGRIGVLVEFEMRSAYTSRVPEVRTFMKGIALHIAASSPRDIESLLSQRYVKDPDKPVFSVLAELSLFVSEEVTVRRFLRWSIDEDPDTGSEPPDPPRAPANVIRMGVKKERGR